MTLRGGQLALLVVLGACSGGAADSVLVLDLEGGVHKPLEVAGDFVHVLVFTSHECPIANSYSPSLRELADRWRDRPVRLFLVHVDPDFGPREAREHRSAYSLPGTVLLDPHHQLAQRLGVLRTPEAVVLVGAGVAYRGRIDDQWQALGARGPVQHNDLADAVTAALAGKQVPLPHPPSVGCLLPEPAPR